MAPWGQTLRKEMHKATTVFHLVMNRFHSIIKKRGEKRKKNYKKKYYQKAAKPILCPLLRRLHIFHMHPVGSSDPLVGCPIYGPQKRKWPQGHILD